MVPYIKYWFERYFTKITIQDIGVFILTNVTIFMFSLFMSKLVTEL